MPPGPRDARLNTYGWMVRPASILERSQRRYGDVWTLRLLGGSTFVVVSHPDLVKQIFTSDPTLLHAGAVHKKIGSPLLGQHSILLADEREHEARRKVMLPLFDSTRVDHHRKVMEQIAEEDLATWPLREPFELLPHMQTITRKVIMSAIFGLTGGEAQQRLGSRIVDLLDWGSRALNMARLHRATFTGKPIPKSFPKVRDPFDALVFEEIERARNDPRLSQRDDILAMLVQATYDDGSPMSDREVRDQMVTLLIQGHTSTATALAWALERLIRHTEMFDRLRLEAASGDERFVDAVITETLRLRPPVPVTMRMVVKQPYQLGEYELDVGTVMAPCMYLLHQRPDLYPEPERFRPERFLEQPPAPYTWIPFGGGNRHCIGRTFAMAEIKVVLQTLARQARLVPADPRDESIRKRGILISPTGSTRAVLEERVAAPSASAVPA